MYCKNCGAVIKECDKYCTACGARLTGDGVESLPPITEYRFVSPPERGEIELFALIGAVFGVLCFLGGVVCYFSELYRIAVSFWMPALAGVILSSVGMRRAVSRDRRGHSLGVVGLVLCALVLVFAACYFVGTTLNDALLDVTLGRPM